MLNKIVFIAIENFNRELEGKSLLAEQFSKKGFFVLLGHKSIIRSLTKIYPIPKQIYIDKGVSNGSKDRIQKLKEGSMHVFSFDEEALMQTDNKIYSLHNHEEDSIKNLDGIFSWGPKHSKLLEYLGYKDNQIIKTGNPRFDIYKIKKKLPTIKQKINNESGFILLCSRFCKQRSAEMLDGSLTYMKGFQLILNQFLQIPRLIRESGINTPILIRPHPSENHMQWIKSTNMLENITISSKGPVSNVFDKAIIMIHNRCTTGIEAYLSNLPVISYEPIELPAPPHPPKELISSFSTFEVNNNKELIECISNQLQDNKSFKNKLETGSDYLYGMNDLNYIKIADYLFKKIPPSKNGINLFDLFLTIFLIYSINLYHNLLNLKLFFKDKKKYSYIKNKIGRNFLSKKNNSNTNYQNRLFSSVLLIPNVKLFIPTKK